MCDTNKASVVTPLDTVGKDEPLHTLLNICPGLITIRIVVLVIKTTKSYETRIYVTK
jgi:hypothetical protein